MNKYFVKKNWFNDHIYYFLNNIYRFFLFKLNNISTFSIDVHMYLTMSILVIIHSKAILIKIIQTTFNLFNQLYIIVSKHRSISQNHFSRDQLTHTFS